jgi:hypothetical protein
MVSFDNIEDYSSYINGLSLDQLLEIEKSINRAKYPERYKLVKELIDKRSSSPSRDVYETKEETKYLNSINFIQKTYLVIICISVLVFIYKVFTNAVSEINIPSFILNFTLLLFIYWGIRSVKKWVVILVLLFAYVGLIRTLLNFLADYSDVAQLFAYRTLDLLFLCFFIYQIIVFSKKETKEYFGSKEKIIISNV